MHSSLLLRLPEELHLLIGNSLKQDGELDTLAVVARTSKRLCSIYEPQLYHNRNCQDALLWGASHNSIPVMAKAKSYGADLDKQVQSVKSQIVTTTMGTAYGPIFWTSWATALQLAVSHGHDEAVRWLLDRGAELNDFDSPSNNACPDCNRHRTRDTNGQRRSLLHLAICGAQHVPTLRLLLARGASLEAAAQIDGEHPVHAAVRAELPARERHDPLAPISRRRHLPLREDQWPPWHEPLTLLKVILEHMGTDESAISALNSIGWYESTPLKTAIYIRDAAVMQQAITLLVRAGASLTRPVPPSPWRQSMAPFWWMLHERGCRAEYATAFLDLGVDVNGERPDDPVPEGWKSPLHFIIRHKRETNVYTRLIHVDNGGAHRGLVAELLRRGARLDITDAKGLTPLGNAMSNGAEDLPLKSRAAAVKMVRLMLRLVQRPRGISEELENEAREWMEVVVRGLRAEKATVEEIKYAPPLYRGPWSCRRPPMRKTIRLGWPGWNRSGSGGRLVRARR
ncbi:hypothetical protein N0V85_005285 [Neurospora sp. IMI 360204]|nr:hypothetical protein N0V85_005285 [Neurospora sp. IMI 360204]